MDDSWDDVERRVKSITREHLGISEPDISLGAAYIDDLKADSLDTVELVMAFEEEFQLEIPDDAAESIVTLEDTVAFIAPIFAYDEQADHGFHSKVIAFRLTRDGKIEVGLRGTDGSWTYPDHTQKLSSGIYVAIFNQWSTILKELEELVNSSKTCEADLQVFFEKHPKLLTGDEYDRVIPQAVIKPDYERVNWRADFVLHPHDQSAFCKIIELKLPSAPTIKSDKSGHSRFYASLLEGLSQLRDYGSAFSSKYTRDNFKNAYGIDMFHPDLQLVVGRRWSVQHINAMLERQRIDQVGIVDWDTTIERLKRKFG